jgi:hypothetical protein
VHLHLLDVFAAAALEEQGRRGNIGVLADREILVHAPAAALNVRVVPDFPLGRRIRPMHINPPRFSEAQGLLPGGIIGLRWFWADAGSSRCATSSQ